jgi:acetyl esterase/lipase
VFVPTNLTALKPSASTASLLQVPNAPVAPAQDEINFPVIIDFHGGGFVFGTCMEQAPFCALMSRELGAVVITVDYRMGPIDTFPAAIEDGEDILDAVLREGAPGYAELREAIQKKVTENFARALENAREKVKLKKTRSAEKLPSSANSSRSNLSVPEVSSAGLSRTPSPTPSMASNSSRSKRKRMKANRKVAPTAILDCSRVALSGFSSGGNLALNLALSLSPPDVEADWPSKFPQDYQSSIPLLLFYPSFDARQLPSEREEPAALAALRKGAPKSASIWSTLDSIVMPTYLPRDQAAHPRASPGLAPISSLHPKATVLLILPELDSLNAQSEVWVEKMQQEGRGEDLWVERYKGMKHGWTQFPEAWLGEEERKATRDAFGHAVGFAKASWNFGKGGKTPGLATPGLGRVESYF